MFGELPKLFDRNFVIGYFLPFAAFLAVSAVSIGLMGGFGLFPGLLTLSKADILVGTTIYGLVSWLGGVGLLATNRDIFRLMEGYKQFNPARLFAWIQKNRYRRLHRDRLSLDEQFKCYRDRKEEVPQELRNERNELMRREARQFPDQERWLLPTAFGNTIRAFEVYPRVMYGLEAIEGWIPEWGTVIEAINCQPL